MEKKLTPNNSKLQIHYSFVETGDLIRSDLWFPFFRAMALEFIRDLEYQGMQLQHPCKLNFIAETNTHFRVEAHLDKTGYSVLKLEGLLMSIQKSVTGYTATCTPPHIEVLDSVPHAVVHMQATIFSIEELILY